MDISNGSLYFVTESTKSVDWGIAVFYAQQTADDYLRLNFDQGSYQWKRRGKVEARVGSQSMDKFDCDTGGPNQCVFLRGYKIMLRQDIWDKLNSATVVTSRDGQFSSSFRGATSHHSSHGASGSQTDSSHPSSGHSSTIPGPSRQAHIQALQGDPMRVDDELNKPESSSDQKQGSWLGQVILKEEFREEAPVGIVSSLALLHYLSRHISCTHLI